MEGLGGGVGDSGTSFGPFQLHQGGALPGSIPLSNAQSWAWSPAGVNYALDAQAKVAGGLSGRAAIENIVRRFERPADPGSEVSGALKLYGGHLASVGGPAKEQSEFSPMRSPVGGGSEDRRSALLKWALGASDSFIQGKEMPSLSNLLATLTTAQRGNQSLTANNIPTKGSRKLSSASNLPAAFTGGIDVANHGRVDQGVDFAQKNPYGAVASGTISHITPNWYKNTPLITETLDQPVNVGGRAYKHVYYAEEPSLVNVGQRVTPGMAVMRGGGAELGFGNGVQQFEVSHRADHWTKTGQDFLAYLQSRKR